ncbi:MAG TPA: hypothetical protein VGE54_09795 [Brevundimonas sp.]
MSTVAKRLNFAPQSEMRTPATAAWLSITALIAGCTQEAPLDRNTANEASAKDLARAAFAATAPRFVEVTRPGSGPWDPAGPLEYLHFATAPESAGWPGLCKASTAWVSLRSRPGEAPIDTSTVYKIVGDLSPDSWNDHSKAERNKACASAGRVLPTDSSEFGEPIFFRLNPGGEDNVWFAARALQLAIAQAKGGATVTCVPEPTIDLVAAGEMSANDPEAIESRENREGCARAAGTLADLKLERILALDVVPCADGNGDTFCVSAVFLRYAYANHQALWHIRLRYQARFGDNGDVVKVDTLSLQPSFSVYG